MEGIGYWLFLLLLYLLSTLLKKRQQKAARKRLEGEQEEPKPEWEPPDFLKNLFGEEELPFGRPAPAMPEEMPESVPEEMMEAAEMPPLPQPKPATETLRESRAAKREGLKLAREDVSQLRSELKRRDEQKDREDAEAQEGSAYRILKTRIATTPLVGSFFEDVGTLKQAIVLREILGKPRALNKYRPGGPQF